VEDAAPSSSSTQHEVQRGVDRFLALAAHPEVVAALARLTRVPAAPPPRLGTAGIGPWISQRGRAGSWLAAASEWARERGDAAEGSAIALSAAVFGADVAREGSTVARMVGAATETVGTRRLGEAVSAGVDPASLRRARDVLLRLEAAREPVSRLVAWERGYVRSTMAARDEATGLGAGPSPGVEYLWSKDLVRVETLDAWDGVADTVAAALEGSADDVPAALRRLAAVRPENAFLAHLVGSHEPWVRRCETARAWNRVATAACGVALFAARERAFPKRLDDLVPDLLPAVPIDPWSGTPLRYDPATGTVWSLGPNGTDEGGAPEPSSVAEPADLVVRPAAPR
jgi:hypothetical protein